MISIFAAYEASPAANNAANKMGSATVCLLLMGQDSVIIWLTCTDFYIRKTCPCNVYPLNPTFIWQNWGLQGFTYFSYFCSKT